MDLVLKNRFRIENLNILNNSQFYFFSKIDKNIIDIQPPTVSINHHEIIHGKYPIKFAQSVNYSDISLSINMIDNDLEEMIKSVKNEHLAFAIFLMNMNMGVVYKIKCYGCKLKNVSLQGMDHKNSNEILTAQITFSCTYMELENEF